MYSLVDLKPGRAVVVDGVPYFIISSQFGRKSQSKANMQCKLKNLKTGAVVSHNFQGSEKIEPADVGYRHVQYLFNDGTSYTFMNLETYDQFELSTETVNEAREFLKDGLELDVLVYEDRPIAVKVPVTVDLVVKGTMPGVKGDTATGGTKPATLETGLVVNVPLFVHEGDTVRVNTERREYVERV